MSHDLSHDYVILHIQVDQEVAKLLKLKAKVEDSTETTGGKFVLKYPKVQQLNFFTGEFSTFLL